MPEQRLRNPWCLLTLTELREYLAAEKAAGRRVQESSFWAALRRAERAARQAGQSKESTR